MNRLCTSPPAVAVTGFVLSLCMALASTSASATISQTPLLLGGGGVPGNLVLTPSVEFPTVISVANIEDTYSQNTTYAGYFDSAKCYTYTKQQITVAVFGTISAADGGGYFRPSRFATDCAGEWSGNYLNWATTQTIDPFRKALTGGYRVVDTESQTILEKATRSSRNSYFPDRSLPKALSYSVSPYNNQDITSSVINGSTDFQKNKAVKITTSKTTCNNQGKQCKTKTTNDYYTVRVEVCVAGLLESNCVKYGNNYKPEGLIQQYSDNIRYSVFGYVTEDGNTRNGGVLRAQQKYVGARKKTPDVSGDQDNTAKEWNPDTGIFITDPNSNDTTTGNSGVINYINKFGELTNKHKSNDPVSELYYAAIRYLKNQGNIASWSNITNEDQRDKFPVITTWEDPIQYACQKNVILGIGDVNTHYDHDVPAGGDTLNVNDYTQKVFTLEGIGTAPTAQFNGNGNSAYIAGLAYYANTQDIRPQMAGTQTASTHWVDVRENKELKSKNKNQYWLAAKYGGFKVPDNYVLGTALTDSAWWTSNEYLETGDKRPDNFYVASDANKMIASLTKAFAQIANEIESTTASLASNSTRLDTDTAVFQSRLNSTHWSGDLLAKTISSDGSVASTATWSAADKLDARTSARNILTIAPANTTSSTGPWISTTGSTFTWSGLTSTQKATLQNTDETDSTLAQQRLDYLRGDRTKEISVSNQTLPFRMRGSILGDIVNSDPQYSSDEDFGYGNLAWSNGAGSAYKTFRTTTKSTRTPLIVVGANDGMLHGFNASMTGNDMGSELFAIVPNAAFTNLINLTDPAYSHRYFVDGTPRIADAYINSSWKTLVAATTGAGGKSVFVVDVTDPSNVSSNSVLWEFSHPAMGYTMGQPSIVALPNGKFGVVVSSGYHDTAPTEGHVWVLDAADGSIIKDFTIPSAGNLGQPLATDTNYDRVADRIYTADTLGNVWRLDLKTSTANGWGAPTSLNDAPLFIAKDGSGNRQAITAPLNSAFNNKGEHMVLFGTGSFYRTGDNEIPDDPNIDSFYGVIDKGSAIDGRSTLLAQTVIKEATVEGNLVRAISNNALTTEKGWYLDLVGLAEDGSSVAKGERVIAKASVRSEQVTFTSMTPNDDPCASGGTSMIMTTDLSSGSRLTSVYYDANGDGVLNSSDTTTIDGEEIPWSGIGDPDDGVVKGVSNISDGAGGGWLCYAGSNGADPVCIKVAGSLNQGRQSWREIRTTN